MIATLVNLLILVLVGGLLVYLIRWALAYFQVPDPIHKIVWVIVLIVVILALLRLVVGVGGNPIQLV